MAEKGLRGLRMNEIPGRATVTIRFLQSMREWNSTTVSQRSRQRHVVTGLQRVRCACSFDQH